MVMKYGKDYYEDISDDLLYVSQEINQKVSDDEYNLTEELDTIKEIVERLESPSSE